jgi:hypothetical protein
MDVGAVDETPGCAEPPFLGRQSRGRARARESLRPLRVLRSPAPYSLRVHLTLDQDKQEAPGAFEVVKKLPPALTAGKFWTQEPPA